MADKVKIEWKHYAKKGETCTRCNNTGDNVRVAIKKLSEIYKDVEFDYTVTELSAEKMSESNSILINGVPIENVLELKASENHCHSCSCLAGADTNCRTVITDSQTFETVPTELIVSAIEKVLNPTCGK